MRTFSQFNRASYVIATIVAVTAAGGCSKPDTVSSSPESFSVYRGSLVERYLLTGEFEAVASTKIKVPRTREFELQIQRLPEDGEPVAKGAVILEFDNSGFVDNLDQQRTAVRRSRRTLLQIEASSEARLRESEAAVERSRIAFAKSELDASVPESIRSRYDFSNLQLAKERAQAAYAKSLSDLEATRASVESDVRVNLETHQKVERELAIAENAVTILALAAPRDGIVVVENNPREDRKYQVGDVVYPGWSVVDIPDLGVLQVRAALSDVDDGRIAPGMAVRCIPDIAPTLVLTGTVAEITPIAREQRFLSERRGFDVRIELDQGTEEARLMPGMSVRVEVETEPVDGLLIPRAAVDFSTDPPRARQPGNRWIDIEVGPCTVHDCTLLGGLFEGDELISIGSGESL